MVELASMSARRRLLRLMGVALALIGPPAFAQPQHVIVTRDHASIWRGEVHTVAVTAKVGTVLDVVRREGNWYVVVIPTELGGQNETGLIAVSQVEPASNRVGAPAAQPTAPPAATLSPPQSPARAATGSPPAGSNAASAATTTRVSGSGTGSQPGPVAHGVGTAVATSVPTVTPSAASRRRTEVTIIDRLDNATQYTYVVPGFWNSSSNTNLNCSSVGNTVNCDGTTRTTGLGTTPHPISYSVRGATLSLKLPDGRVAVVNCDSKYALRGDYINRRSCRMPLVSHIQTEFSGDQAKLFWTTSLDGSKMESETYKILAVLDRP